MKRKKFRTFIITMIVLMAALLAVRNIDIEPAKTKKESEVVSLEKAEVETPQEKIKEDKEAKETFVEQKVEKEEEKVLQTEVISDSAVVDNVDKNEVEENTEEQDLTKRNEHKCTLEIRCDTVIDTSKLENQAVVPYIPQNGTILERTEIVFTDGESVFDILLRATKERNIHMEFKEDNLYSGKYIEGINYLYELDAGPLSGWMYKVNGKFPNYGCASYAIKDGDEVMWIYTCDLGVDVGDNSTW